MEGRGGTGKPFIKPYQHWSSTSARPPGILERGTLCIAAHFPLFAEQTKSFMLRLLNAAICDASKAGGRRREADCTEGRGRRGSGSRAGVHEHWLHVPSSCGELPLVGNTSLCTVGKPSD